MTITRIESPMNAPTTAIVVAAPYCPQGPILIGTSSSEATIPDAEHLPKSFQFAVKEFNPGFQVGTRMRAAVTGTTDQWMEGIVTGFDYATNTLTLAADLISGSGVTHGGVAWQDWTLNITGQPGARGERGETGAKGDKGDAGGPTGPMGPPGAKGDDGPQGPQGEAATISVGTTTTVPTGDQASVTNSGTSNTAVLDFVIPGGGPIGPQGDKGDKGDKGDPGGLMSVAPPLAVDGGGQVSLNVASPLAVSANQLSLDLSDYVLRDGSRSFTGVMNGIAPAATANDTTIPTTAWTKTELGSKFDKTGGQVTGSINIASIVAPTTNRLTVFSQEFCTSGCYACNAYIDASNQWRRIAAGPAAIMYSISTGNLNIASVATGIAGSIITWGQEVAITPNGTISASGQSNEAALIVRGYGAGTYNFARIFTGNSAGLEANCYIIHQIGVMAGLILAVDAASFRFDSAGNAYKWGGGTWSDSSDNRTKNVVGDYQNGLTAIEQLQPVIYTFKGNDTQGPPSTVLPTAKEPAPRVQPTEPPYRNSPHYQPAIDGTEYIGLIAQECEAVMPELVKKTSGTIDGKDVRDLRQLDTSPLIFALINAVKELSQEVRSLKQRIVILEK